MINLLPLQQREAIMYARRNTKLLRWVIGLAIVMVLMVLLWAVGYAVIDRSIASYEQQIASKEVDLQNQQAGETEQRVQAFSNNMKLIVKVLSQQVVFSQLFREVGAVMPPGTVLSNLDISEVDGGIDLVIQAENYDAATQAQVNLEAENKLFEKADIISVTCGSAGQYPCTANLRALFTSNNPFLFLNQSSEATNE